MIIDNEIAGKIKSILADTITKEIKDNSKKNKASVNVNSIFGNLPRDAMIEQNNKND